MARLRLFIAIDLPDQQREQAMQICRDLKAAKWTRPEQLHITLRFLGSTPEDLLDQIETQLATVRASPFELAVRGFGTFPAAKTQKPARVLWAGLDPPHPVQALKPSIDSAIIPILGADAETAAHGYTPHLTLARFNGRPGSDLRQFLVTHASWGTRPWTVDTFHLYSSSLLAEGAVHQRLASFPLMKPP